MSDQFTRYDEPTGYGAPQTPEEPVKLNPWAAVFTVLWAPREVFALVRQRAPIAAPYLGSMVITFISALIGALNMPRFTDQIMQQAMQNGGGEQAAQVAAVAAKVTAWVAVVIGGLGGPWLSGLVMSIFLLLFGLALRPVRPSFAQYFPAAAYIRVPLLLGSIAWGAMIRTRILGISPDLVNVDGGAVALGHPLAASGVRILMHLIYALRKPGGRYGFAAFCSGGGQGRGDGCAGWMTKSQEDI